ncbi:unnamed protein product [Prorocentrum cordatum]|uniref:Uncharacterized protein n=1 Tax=Prorocentrum cordatum TaxID=2364126 RepID=A0ABN9VXJ8_9DINO|nr:unnamed protein product [Polarella glacialis]
MPGTSTMRFFRTVTNVEDEYVYYHSSPSSYIHSHCVPVEKGAFAKEDLAMIAGRLWFDMAGMPLTYHAEYVPSKLNLADGPSRNDASLLELCIGRSFMAI